MIEIGRMAVKIAGRDSGMKCIIVDVIDDNFVLIDGQTRRKRCNVNHLELLKDVIKIKKGASHSDIVNEFEKLGIEIKERKPKEAKPRPKKIRKKKEKPVKEIPKKEEKKPVKEEEIKTEEKPVPAVPKPESVEEKVSE